MKHLTTITFILALFIMLVACGPSPTLTADAEGIEFDPTDVPDRTVEFEAAVPTGTPAEATADPALVEVQEVLKRINFSGLPSLKESRANFDSEISAATRQALAEAMENLEAQVADLEAALEPLLESDAPEVAEAQQILEDARAELASAHETADVWVLFTLRNGEVITFDSRVFDNLPETPDLDGINYTLSGDSVDMVVTHGIPIYIGLDVELNDFFTRGSVGLEHIANMEIMEVIVRRESGDNIRYEQVAVRLFTSSQWVSIVGGDRENPEYILGRGSIDTYDPANGDNPSIQDGKLILPSVDGIDYEVEVGDVIAIHEIFGLPRVDDPEQDYESWTDKEYITSNRIIFYSDLSADIRH